MDFSAYEKEYSKLLDPSEPLDSRTRELYRLKESILKTPAGVHILSLAMDRTDSVLLQHELAYNIGQSGLELACPVLERVALDRSYDPVTRHEAIESLGAIAAARSKPLLQHLMDPNAEPEVAVRESCELALARLLLREAEGDAALSIPANCAFVSIDPAPPLRGPTDISAWAATLRDDSGAVPLFQRYRAMFALRNAGTQAAVAALTCALRNDRRSALLRHEVAFVLGQMEHPASRGALEDALRDETEAPMVRHEAAEALGAMADDASLKVLAEFATHPEPIVRDSCVVAMEMHKYWAQFNAHGVTRGVESSA